jgi:hypothetical protein
MTLQKIKWQNKKEMHPDHPAEQSFLFCALHLHISSASSL